jgi:hypothetical protein
MTPEGVGEACRPAAYKYASQVVSGTDGPVFGRAGELPKKARCFAGLGRVVQHVGPLELNQDGWLRATKSELLEACNLLVGYGSGRTRQGRAEIALFGADSDD